MYIKVKVVADSKSEKIQKVKDDLYHISVKEPALRNLANKRICEIIASIYGLNTKAVRVVSGHHSSSKILSINI